MNKINENRRDFLRAAAFGTGVFIAGCNDKERDPIEAKHTEKGKEQEEEVAPAEDLMREHGVLKRVLLVYGESIQRLENNQDLPPEALNNAAGIIRSFIEDYHEKSEEDQLFPRFRKANTQVELVEILTQQHQAGRKLTDTTLRLSNAQAMKNPDDRRALIDSLQQFIRMYNPHEAREDTVLFPAFKNIVSKNEYDALGEDFEKKEHQMFGEDGFEKMVDRVAGIEKSLGIYDLAKFTPKV